MLFNGDNPMASVQDQTARSVSAGDRQRIADNNQRDEEARRAAKEYPFLRDLVSALKR